jgi:hypothetical protein
MADRRTMNGNPLAAAAFALAMSHGAPAVADPDDGGNVDELIVDMTLGMLGGVAWAGVSAGSLVFTGVNVYDAAVGLEDWTLLIPGYALGTASSAAR